jgi:S-formylglutathione hydrolase FrmB
MGGWRCVDTLASPDGLVRVTIASQSTRIALEGTPLRYALFFFALLSVAISAARAQEFEPASIETIETETRFLGDLEGPQAGAPRPIAIWRAPSTPSGPLPTLYMADGADGLYVVAARLRPVIEAGLIPAVQIIGLYPDREHRQAEYIERGRQRYNAHERWVLETVIPWAERVARASPEHRAIGGYSNGAAFALFMAAEHPDVFSAVLAHSPVATADSFRVDARAANVRWALSAGRLEYRGYPFRAVTTVRGVVTARGAAVRTCTGTWDHEPEAWASLSPGAVAWLFDFPNAPSAATALERDACRVTPSE